MHPSPVEMRIQKRRKGMVFKCIFFKLHLLFAKCYQRRTTLQMNLQGFLLHKWACGSPGSPSDLLGAGEWFAHYHPALGIFCPLLGLDQRNGWSLAYDSITTWKWNGLPVPGKDFSKETALPTLSIHCSLLRCWCFVVVNSRNGRQGKKPLKFPKQDALFKKAAWHGWAKLINNFSLIFRVVLFLFMFSIDFLFSK